MCAGVFSIKVWFLKLAIQRTLFHGLSILQLFFDIDLPIAHSLSGHLWTVACVCSPFIESDQWPVHILLLPQITLLCWNVLFFYFLFPPVFVASAPLWPLCNRGSSIKEDGKLLVFVCVHACVCVRACVYACHLDPWSVQALISFFTSPCASGE